MQASACTGDTCCLKQENTGNTDSYFHFYIRVYFVFMNITVTFFYISFCQKSYVVREREREGGRQRQGKRERERERERDRETERQRETERERESECQKIKKTNIQSQRQ